MVFGSFFEIRTTRSSHSLCCLQDRIDRHLSIVWFWSQFSPFCRPDSFDLFPAVARFVWRAPTRWRSEQRRHKVFVDSSRFSCDPSIVRRRMPCLFWCFASSILLPLFSVQLSSSLSKIDMPAPAVAELHTTGWQLKDYLGDVDMTLIFGTLCVTASIQPRLIEWKCLKGQEEAEYAIDRLVEEKLDSRPVSCSRWLIMQLSSEFGSGLQKLPSTNCWIKGSWRQSPRFAPKMNCSAMWIWK